MIKKLIKRAITSVVKRLPSGAQLAMAEGFNDAASWILLTKAAPRCNLASISVNGDYGVIEFTPGDEIIIPHYAQYGEWAKQTNDILIDFFKDGGTYFDVGANIGLTTIPIANARPNVRCVAFEPEPANYKHLTTNIAKNCGSNVETKQVALYSKRDKLKFELATKNFGGHRLSFTDGTIEVEAAPLDDFSIGAKPFAVKMDVEGAEPFAFMGGRKVFAQADLIIFEWSPYSMGVIGANPNEVTFLRGRHLMAGKEGERPVDTTVEELLALAAKYKLDPMFHVDVIARKV